MISIKVEFTKGFNEFMYYDDGMLFEYETADERRRGVHQVPVQLSEKAGVVIE